MEKFLPLRAEITKAFLYNFEFNTEEILESYYTCDNYATFLHSTKIAFDWSNVLFDGYMNQFKRKVSGFCLGTIIAHLKFYLVTWVKKKLNC